MTHHEKQMKSLKYKELQGLSQRQLEEHHGVLYAGYVKKINEIRSKLIQASRTEANATYSEVRELKLEETFATNATRLHEHYFANLGGSGAISGPISDMINDDFGSFEAWRDDLIAAGICARGWVVLAYDFDDNQLHNYSLDVHNVGCVWNCIPLVVLDVYEHAYFIDYGTNRKGYLEAFLKNLDWDFVNSLVKKYNLIDMRRVA
jgi:Fe-Mn family superoxide dismutase